MLWDTLNVAKLVAILQRTNPKVWTTSSTAVCTWGQAEDTTHDSLKVLFDYCNWQCVSLVLASHVSGFVDVYCGLVPVFSKNPNKSTLVVWWLVKLIVRPLFYTKKAWDDLGRLNWLWWRSVGRARSPFLQALEACVKLANQFIADRCLPDKATLPDNGRLKIEIWS